MPALRETLIHIMMSMATGVHRRVVVVQDIAVVANGVAGDGVALLVNKFQVGLPVIVNCDPTERRRVPRAATRTQWQLQSRILLLTARAFAFVRA